jgi:superfamily II DNA or RNA helicase
MRKLTIQLQNNAMMCVLCDPAIRNELSEYFCFFVPGYKFMPAYRKRVWDGKIRLYNSMTCEINVGLYHKVKKFAAERGYAIELKPSLYGVPGSTNKINHQDLVKYFASIGAPYEMRDYQYEAVTHAIENKRALLLSPTGSGKSFIIYNIMRWYLENNKKNVLIVVPTTGLVEQMYKDFKDYGYDSENNCHIIYSGKDKNTDKRIIISTWQSIYKLQKEWFEQFGCIFGDECHLFKAKSLSGLMNKAINANYRFGTTGTLDGTQTHKLVLEGLFGPTKKVTTTKELQESNTLAALEIQMLLIDYSRELRLENVNRKYQEELEFIVTYAPRNNFIRNLALTQRGNTLVLFQFVEKHGKILYDLIKEKSKNCFYVHGGTDISDREAIRGIVEKKDGAIIVASLGTFSTGINIRNLHNIIFASPSKSQVRVLQSIGRGLRKADNGQHTILYDIADDLNFEGQKNFTLKHSEERMKIYSKEKFDIKVEKINL